MFRSKVTSLILAVVLIGVMFVSVAETQAGWWHHWGWGCCSYPAYGGWYAPVGWRSWGWGYPYYSYGYGWRGCGWRSCCWSSCCYDPCYSTCYCDPCCCGTVVTPSTPTIESDQTPTPAPQPDPNLPGSQPDASGAAESQTRTTISADAGLLTIRVPADAAVFINGYRTKSTGAARQYVSNGLKPGRSYKYEIRAEMVRDGRLVEETRVVYLTAGNTESLAFSFDSNPEQRLATIW